MSAHEHVERRPTVWMRLWEVLHGPVDLTPTSEHRALWARLSELEEAARQLEALEDVEEQRGRRP